MPDLRWRVGHCNTRSQAEPGPTQVRRDTCLMAKGPRAPALFFFTLIPELQSGEPARHVPACLR